MDCHVCNGNGDIDCYNCHYHGIVIANTDGCNVNECVDCYGTGTVVCYNCLGRGRIE